MFEDPEENPAERSTDPMVRAGDKSDEFRMHAEFAAVFEGHRKFGAQVRPDLDANLARELQRMVGRMDKSRDPSSPLLTDSAAIADAMNVLDIPIIRALTTNDYHVQHRPGEVMIARWLGGEGQSEQVQSFYDRMQAHFDVALNQFREEERQSLAWKQDPSTLKYLEALDAIQIKMADRYLRGPMLEYAKVAADAIASRKSASNTAKSNQPAEPIDPADAIAPSLFLLSTQAADELDILHLTDYMMGVGVDEIVGSASAPPEDAPTEQDRAWFFKLFSLRGILAGTERLCFFAYLQKSDESDW